MRLPLARRKGLTACSQGSSGCKGGRNGPCRGALRLSPQLFGAADPGGALGLPGGGHPRPVSRRAAPQPACVLPGESGGGEREKCDEGRWGGRTHPGGRPFGGGIGPALVSAARAAVGPLPKQARRRCSGEAQGSSRGPLQRRPICHFGQADGSPGSAVKFEIRNHFLVDGERRLSTSLAGSPAAFAGISPALAGAAEPVGAGAPRRGGPRPGAAPKTGPPSWARGNNLPAGGENEREGQKKPGAATPGF